VFQNKNVMCQYRAVGHPIACSVTEGLVDLAAAKIGMDPAEIRRRNLIRDDAYPCESPSGLKFELLSHHACLDKLLAMMVILVSGLNRRHCGPRASIAASASPASLK
jgi:aerobic carbon-monoxide dehydrogenase large subunit